MPSVVPLEEAEDVDRFDPDEFVFDQDFLCKVTSAEGTEEVNSPDEACELMCDLVAEQFWDWFHDPSHGRRFKPRVKVYEVS